MTHLGRRTLLAAALLTAVIPSSIASARCARLEPSHDDA